MTEHKHKAVLLAFGQRLAQLRKERGLSQETLALKSGIARSYIGGVERGTRNASLVMIFRIARTLEIPASELLAFQYTTET